LAAAPANVTAGQHFNRIWRAIPFEKSAIFANIAAHCQVCDRAHGILRPAALLRARVTSEKAAQMSLSSIGAATLTAMADYRAASVYAAAASVADPAKPDTPNATAGTPGAVEPIQKATAPGTALTVDVFA
jgi:hypothetical protein